MGNSVKSRTEVQDKWLSCILEDMTLTSGSLRVEDSAMTLMEKSCAADTLFATEESGQSAGQCQPRSSCEVAGCAQIVHSRKKTCLLLQTSNVGAVGCQL